MLYTGLHGMPVHYITKRSDLNKKKIKFKKKLNVCKVIFNNQYNHYTFYMRLRKLYLHPI